MKKVFLTRKISFSASHRLHAPELSIAENQKIFGKCNSANGHGHNYVAEVTLAGPVDPKTGMVFGLDALKAILADTIDAKLDHKHLNLDVPELKGTNPTVENIVIVIWNMLETRLPHGLLYEVRLVETEKNSVVYRG